MSSWWGGGGGSWTREAGAAGQGRRGQLDKGGGGSWTREAGRSAYYENPHSRPSTNFPKRKRASRKDPTDYKRPRRRPGHRGVSHGRKSSPTIHHASKTCRGCSSGRLEAGRIADTRQATDVPLARGQRSPPARRATGVRGIVGRGP